MTFIMILTRIFFYYFIICILLYFIQGKLIFFPQPLSAAQYESYKELEVSFQREDDISLHGWFLKGQGEGAKKLIIYFGGNAEEVSGSFAEFRDNLDSSLLVINYRGFGKSKGSPSQEALFADGLFIYDEIKKKHGFSEENIILFGRSLGSGVATFVASKRKVGKVILVTPFDSVLNIARKKYFIFPVKLLLNHPFPSVVFAANIAYPLLEIVATEDEVIPNAHSKSLFEAWKGEKKYIEIEGANHQNVSNFRNYWTEIRDFISSQ